MEQTLTKWNKLICECCKAKYSAPIKPFAQPHLIPGDFLCPAHRVLMRLRTTVPPTALLLLVVAHQLACSRSSGSFCARASQTLTAGTVDGCLPRTKNTVPAWHLICLFNCFSESNIWTVQFYQNIVDSSWTSRELNINTWWGTCRRRSTGWGIERSPTPWKLSLKYVILTDINMIVYLLSRSSASVV